MELGNRAREYEMRDQVAGVPAVATTPPPLSQGMSRVVMRGRVLPLTHFMTEADHAEEVRARELAAKKVHARALAVSITSGTWNMYVPQS